MSWAAAYLVKNAMSVKAAGPLWQTGLDFVNASAGLPPTDIRWPTPSEFIGGVAARAPGWIKRPVGAAAQAAGHLEKLYNPVRIGMRLAQSGSPASSSIAAAPKPANVPKPMSTLPGALGAPRRFSFARFR